jgi:hypothetical protein
MPNESAGALQALLTALASAETWLQAAAIGAALLSALLASHRLNLWRRQHPSSMPGRGARARLTEIGAIEAPVLLALLILLILRTLIAAAGGSVHLLDIAMELAATLVLVRLAMYLLRLGLGPDSWMRKWEQPLTLIIWLGISFQLIGWFEAIQNTLNDINLLPGRGQFTLWALLKGLVIISAFVLVTSVLARALERRIMTIESIALSTRLGNKK